MTNEQELKMYFQSATELAAARLTGDRARISDALDDVEMFAMHSDNPKLAQRAQDLLADWIR